MTLSPLFSSMSWGMYTRPLSRSLMKRTAARILWRMTSEWKTFASSAAFIPPLFAPMNASIHIFVEWTSDLMLPSFHAVRRSLMRDRIAGPLRMSGDSARTTMRKRTTRLIVHRPSTTPLMRTASSSTTPRPTPLPGMS